MSDEIDNAQDREQLDRDICLKIRRPILPITGTCYWCGEVVSRVFCSPDCREDYDKHKRFND